MLARRAFIISGLALVCFVGVLVLDTIQPFAYVRLRYLYRDAISRAGRPTPPNPDLVFLAVDAASVGLSKIDIDAYGLSNDNSEEARALRLMSESWPWSREVYALVLDRLISAGARVVAFDLLFPTSTDNDTPFRLALDRYRDHVVIGSNFVNGDREPVGGSVVNRILTRPSETLVPQTSPMDDRVACTNFWPDDDEVVRRAQYRVTSEQVWDIAPKPGSERFLSLAAATLIKAGFKKNVPPDLDDHTLRFTGAPRRGFPPHSLFEIFVPDFWKHNYNSGEFFRDKIVIVGAEGNWQHDELVTPFGSMPGAELHLNAINAGLRHEFIRELSPAIAGAFAFIAGLIGIALSLAIRLPWLRLALLIGIGAGAFWIALIFFNYVSLYLPMIGPMAELNATVVLGLIADFTSERLEKTRLRRTLERYVSRDVVREMVDRPKLFAQSLGGVIKPATILFTDLRGYSAFAASREPQALLAQLNDYFGAMVDCVFRYGGTLDKFIGDAVMAVWGNLHSNGPRNDAIAAVGAALAMRAELALLNKKWRALGWPELRAGTAINHGKVVAGNIGSPQRMEFTVIGEPVNLSWKLQELTKQFGCDLIVSEEVRVLVAEHFDLQPIGRAHLPGLESPREIFTVCGSVEIDVRDNLSRVVQPYQPAMLP
jgi:adenylate cyclase